MQTLIQLQEDAIAAMNETRTSERRAAKLRKSVMRKYRAKALALGYTPLQAAQQVRDVLDIYWLRVWAGE